MLCKLFTMQNQGPIHCYRNNVTSVFSAHTDENLFSRIAHSLEVYADQVPAQERPPKCATSFGALLFGLRNNSYKYLFLVCFSLLSHTSLLTWTIEKIYIKQFSNSFLSTIYNRSPKTLSHTTYIQDGQRNVRQAGVQSCNRSISSTSNA